MKTAKIRAKFPIKIGQTLVPAKTEGMAHSELPASLKKTFPNMQTSRDGFICAEFPPLAPCLVLQKQVEVID